MCTLKKEGEKVTGATRAERKRFNRLCRSDSPGAHFTICQLLDAISSRGAKAPPRSTKKRKEASLMRISVRSFTAASQRAS